MKLALAALLVSTIAHADVRTTAVADTKWSVDKSGWEYAIQTGDDAHPAVALVKVPLGGTIASHFKGAIFGTAVRGTLELDNKALAAGSTWTGSDELTVHCEAESGADCLIVLYLPGGFALERPMMIKPKKVKVKDVVQPVQKEPRLNPYQ